MTAMVSRIMLNLRNVGSSTAWARATAFLPSETRRNTTMVFAHQHQGDTTLGGNSDWMAGTNAGSHWTGNTYEDHMEHELEKVQTFDEPPEPVHEPPGPSLRSLEAA